MNKYQTKAGYIKASSQPKNMVANPEAPSLSNPLGGSLF